MELEFLPCPTCREITIFEVPPVTDEQVSDDVVDDTERACTVCGTALTFAGITLATIAPRARRRSRPAA